MKKKKEKKEKKEKVDEVGAIEETKVELGDSPISPVTIDFGRADLNQLRDVLNQLASRS